MPKELSRSQSREEEVVGNLYSLIEHLSLMIAGTGLRDGVSCRPGEPEPGPR